MGLAQDIVVVNEFTTKTARGGTRGGTPGSYVTRYMSRDGATEDLTPVRLMDANGIDVRYQDRDMAGRDADSVHKVHRGISKADGMGGIAFGTGSLSLSDAALKESSKKIQDAFEDRKTVMKTVISFSQEYLDRMGCLIPGEPIVNRGDYRGRVDQMKLRLAISKGMSALSHRGFSDLHWVGVIQVDTQHVHCHIAAVDLGDGRERLDGTQRGMLTDSDKTVLRQGIHHSLQMSSTVRAMSSNVGQDKANARQIVRRFVAEQVARRAVPQVILAALPDDTRMWRAGTHAKAMRRANELTRTYVNSIVLQPGSGWASARADIEAYAARRQREEGLSFKETMDLVDKGVDNLMDTCVNAVYGVLKAIPKEQRRTSTPMLDLMATDVSDLSAIATNDVTAEFVFRLRTYSKRADTHRVQAEKMHALRKNFEAAETVQAAEVMHQFYLIEEEYQLKCMTKYRNFFRFLDKDEDFSQELDDLNRELRRLSNLEAMAADENARQMDAQRAEEYCQRVYGVSGGRFLAQAPHVIEVNLDEAASRYDAHVDDFMFRLKSKGYLLNEEDYHDTTMDKDDIRGGLRSRLRIVKDSPYSFDEIKALDLHELGYDFGSDVRVSKGNIDTFLESAQERIGAFDAALAYLQATGQSQFIDYILPVEDVANMRRFASEIARTGVLVSERPESAKLRHTHTISLDVSLNDDLERAVKTSISERERL